MLGGVVCLDGWVWVGDGFAGRVYSWGWIAVEIQQLNTNIKCSIMRS